MQNFVTLTEEGGENPYLIFDESWRLRMVTVLVTWSFALDEAEEQTPPERMAPFHRKWIEVLQKLDSASADIVYGIDNYDADRLNDASEKIVEVTVLINEAGDLFPTW